MLDIRRQGSIASVLAELRGIPERVIPYAAATALTRSAQAAQKGVVAGMKQGFDRPTPYTLNSTFIQAASKDKLSARVAVKNQASGGGILPENFLLPEVLGGARKEKRAERQLRYAGILTPGWRAIAGKDAPKDAYGNLNRSDYTSLRRAFGAQKLGKQKGTRKERFFLLGRPGAYRGVFTREGGGITALLVFTHAQPQYRQRLDFDGLSADAAEKTFPAEFEKAVASIMSRNPR